MLFVGFRYDVVGYKLTPICLGNPLLEICPFLVAQYIHPGATSFDLARILGELVLILLRPRGDLFE